MKRILIALFIGLLGSAMTCGSVWAQATAQISGTVRDQSGAVLPGVEVTATQTDTGITRTTVTNETGSYILPNLPVGPYRLEAALPGFRTFVQTGIVLQVNSNPVINAVLEVGQVTEQVEVQANAALVETRSTCGRPGHRERAHSGTAAQRTQGHRPDHAVRAPLSRGRTSGRQFHRQGVAHLVAGGSLRFGIDVRPGRSHAHTIRTTASHMPLPFPDALQEFKVETSGLSAQQADGDRAGRSTR